MRFYGNRTVVLDENLKVWEIWLRVLVYLNVIFIMVGVEMFFFNVVLIFYILDLGNVNILGKCLIMIFKKNSICFFILGWVKSKYYKVLKFKM